MINLEFKKTKQAEFGSRILEFIQNNNWTKKEFAEKVGIPATHVGPYIKGEYDPLNLLGPMLELGLNEKWFLTGDKGEIHESILQRLDKIELEIRDIKAENYDLLMENKKLKQELLQKDESIEALFNELGKIHLASSQLEALRNIVSIKR